MSAEQRVQARRRRTRAEIRQLVAEFVSSGMRRSDFCRRRGLSFGTHARHLKQQPWKSKTRSAAASGQFLPVEWPVGKLPSERDPSCALAVVLSGGRRIEVQPGFDEHTLERLVSALEQV